MEIGRPREVVEVTPKRVPYEGEEVSEPQPEPEREPEREPATVEPGE